MNETKRKHSALACHKSTLPRCRRGRFNPRSLKPEPGAPIVSQPAQARQTDDNHRSPFHPRNFTMRFLHTMLRVGDLQRSIDFYTQVLGMQLLRRSENPDYQYSLAFLGYEGNPAQAELELTYNWGTESYEIGTAYGHIALGMPDVYAACEKIKAAGGNVTREAGPVKGGSTVIAFVTDPDGYKIELIQRAEAAGGAGLR